jgi:hypothetical protein
MTINEYFMSPEKPAPGSPVGTIMLRILAKDPRVEYEEARSQIFGSHSTLPMFYWGVILPWWGDSSCTYSRGDSTVE